MGLCIDQAVIRFSRTPAMSTLCTQIRRHRHQRQLLGKMLGRRKQSSRYPCPVKSTRKYKCSQVSNEGLRTSLRPLKIIHNQCARKGLLTSSPSFSAVLSLNQLQSRAKAEWASRTSASLSSPAPTDVIRLWISENHIYSSKPKKRFARMRLKMTALWPISLQGRNQVRKLLSRRDRCVKPLRLSMLIRIGSKEIV